MGGKVPPRPHIPSKTAIQLRQRLIREHHEKTTREMDKLLHSEANIVPLMEELAEMLYVVYGTFIQFGVDADEVLAEVHRAKMDRTIRERVRDEAEMEKKEGKPADVAAVISRLQELDYVLHDPW